MIVWIFFHCLDFFIWVSTICKSQTTILLLFLSRLQTTESKSGNVSKKNILEDEEAQTGIKKGRQSQIPAAEITCEDKEVDGIATPRQPLPVHWLNQCFRE